MSDSSQKVPDNSTEDDCPASEPPAKPPASGPPSVVTVGDYLVGETDDIHGHPDIRY